jgi:hypothetical protein
MLASRRTDRVTPSEMRGYRMAHIFNGFQPSKRAVRPVPRRRLPKRGVFQQSARQSPRRIPDHTAAAERPAPCRQEPPLRLASAVRQIVGCGVAVATVLLLSSCGSVRSQPFQRFAQAATELQGNVDRALESGPAASEARFTDEALREVSVVGQLQLASSPADPLLWDARDAPLFMRAELFRAGVRRVAGVFSDYAKLLLELASPELLGPEQFDQLARDLTANAAAAINATSGRQVGAEPFAMLSGAATALLRAYLESRREDQLLEALKANQASIREFSTLLVSATEIAAEYAWDEYFDLVDREFGLIAGFTDTMPRVGPPDEGPSADAATQTVVSDETAFRTAIGRLIALNRGHIAQLETLGALRDMFAALPTAHLGLIRSIESDDMSLTAINAALERSQALATLVDRRASEN